MTARREDSYPWANISGSYAEHSPAHISATPEGLQAIIDAATKALKTGIGTAKLVASDCEGYTLTVKKADTVSRMEPPFYWGHRIPIWQQEHATKEPPHD